MARFHVTNTFEVRGAKPVFVLAGSIVQGEIRHGMLMRVPLNSGIAMTAPVYSVEFARRTDGGEDVCLCFRLDPETLEIWRGLNLRDEVFEITADGSD